MDANVRYYNFDAVYFIAIAIYSMWPFIAIIATIVIVRLPITQIRGKAYYLRDEAFNLLVSFSQYLYGSESITYENDHLKINEKHYQKTNKALQMLLYYNGIVIVSLVVLSLRFLVSEETSTDCVNNANCYTVDDTNFTERIMSMQMRKLSAICLLFHLFLPLGSLVD